MTSKQKTERNKETASKQPAPKPPIQNSEILMKPQTHPLPLIQRARSSPESLTPRDVLQLQSIVDNQTIQRLLARKIQPSSANRTGSRLSVQTKLTLGPEGDLYENEADRTARDIVNSIPISPAPSTTPRQSEAEVRKQTTSQGVGLEAGNINPDLEPAIQGARGGGKMLSGGIRQPMEQAFGVDFSGVKIHTDERADRLNQALQAQAFTTGQDIFFKQGEYNPEDRTGQKLLAHELTHVVQQNNHLRRSLDDEQKGDGADQATQPASIPIQISSTQAPSIQCVRRLVTGKIDVWIDLFRNETEVNGPLGDAYIADKDALAKVEVLDETKNPILKVRYNGQEYWLKLPDNIKIVDEDPQPNQEFDMSELDKLVALDFGLGDLGNLPGGEFDLSELDKLLQGGASDFNLGDLGNSSKQKVDLSELDNLIQGGGLDFNFGDLGNSSEQKVDLSELDNLIQGGGLDFGDLDNLPGSGKEKKKSKAPDARNFQVGSKNLRRTHQDEVLRIYFDRNSIQLEGDDLEAINQFMANQGTIEIRGFNSEEEDGSLADSRLSAVQNLIPNEKISKAIPLPAIGQGVIKYRNMRMVELALPGKSGFDFKSDEKAPIEQNPTSEITGAYTKAKTEATKMLLEIQTGLETLDQKTINIMKEYFGDKIQPAELMANLKGIAAHMETIGFTCMTPENPHSSSIAYNDQQIPPKIWLNPKLEKFEPEQIALVLIHEVAHSTPDLMTDDLAYGFERIIQILPPEQAIKNSDSYALFVKALSGKEIAYDATPPTDQYDQQLSQVQVQKFKESMAKIHQKVIKTGSIITAVYTRISNTAHKKLGAIAAENPDIEKIYMDDIYWLNQIHEKIFGKKAAQVFQFTVPYYNEDDSYFYPPQLSDAEKLAAVHDRLEKMRVALDDKEGITFSLDPDYLELEAKWEQGPGRKVTVGPGDIQAQERYLTKSLIKATEGISDDVDMVNAYVDLLNHASASGL